MAHGAAGARGAFRLEFDELRAAESGDGLRIAARQAFSRGLRRWDGGDAAGALVDLAAAGSLWRRAGDRRREVDADNEIGQLLLYKPDVQGAYTRLDGALAAARAIGYEGGEAKALAYLAVGDLFLGRPRATVPQRKAAVLDESGRALEIWRRLGDRAEEGEVASNLGYLYSSDNFPKDLGRAVSWYQRGLRLHGAAGDIEGVANTLSGLAIVHQAKGDYEGAEPLLLQARELSRRLPDRRLEAQLVANLAGNYQNLGEPQTALAMFNDPLLTDEKVASFTAVNQRSNVAALYSELGKLDQALDVYRQVLAIQPDGRDRLRTLINMGQALLLRGNAGDAEAALAQFDRALEEALRQRSAEDEALVRESIGGYYLGIHQPERALASLERAQVLRHAAPNRANEADVLVRLGSAYRLLGQTQNADRALAAALALARRSGRSTTLVTCLQVRAAFDLQQGDPETARREIEEAIAKVETERGQVASNDLRISFFGQRRGLYDVQIGVLAELAGRHPAAGYGERALAASERGHARGLLDLIAEGRVGLRRGASPALRERRAALDDERAKAGDRLRRAQAAPSPDGALLGRLESELLRIQRSEQQLDADVRARAAAVDPAPLGAAEIERLLDERTALLEYWFGDRLAYLFVVTRGGLAIHRLARGQADIERIAKKVGYVRQAIERPSGIGLASFRSDAAQLYRDLLPAGADAKPNLLIVADGPLHRLPFEVLLTAEVDRGAPLARLPYLLRGHTVAYVPSASVLASLRRRAASASPRGGQPLSLLAYAFSGAPLRSDPVAAPAALQAAAIPRPAAAVLAPARGAGSLMPLARVDGEVEAIAALYPAAARELYLDARASRKNVVDNPLVGKARLIHFASHGIIDAGHPDLSSLVLAPSPPADDGMLRLADIFNLQLDADLVVLSACETGLGQQVRGEGLVGFTRAFFYAGARSLAVSLWLVPDNSTPELMRALYQRLQGGDSKAEALRQAKLAMIARGRYAHPFYWAPFVLVGDPG